MNRWEEEQMWLEQGIEQGIEQERASMIIRMHEKGMSIEEIAGIAEIGNDDVCRVLGIDNMRKG